MTEFLAFLSTDVMQHPLWMWLCFLILVLALLAFDLGVLNRKDHEIGIKESLLMSAFYIAVGLAFGGWIWWSMGSTSAFEYYTGFVVEKTLAMDNIFVIAMIFAYFQIPRMYQHRVLFWGILGVIVLRGIIIGFGTALVHQYEWILYLFSAFLVYAGVRLLINKEETHDISQNFALRWLHRNFRVSEQLHGNKFLVRLTEPKTGKALLYITPLFVALLTIEVADIIFAVDSIPAILAITTDPFIVYTSNIFAILGLRALYFALAALLARFIYLNYALAAVLIFIGSKIVVAGLLGIEKVPPMISFTVTISLLTAGIVFSLWKTRQDNNRH